MLKTNTDYFRFGLCSIKHYFNFLTANASADMSMIALTDGKIKFTL